MAYINMTKVFDFPISRQDLYDMWDGALSSVGATDLNVSMLPIMAGSDMSLTPVDPAPGTWYWNRSENVMYIFHDVIDNTGVSLWLACGPDKFETAMLADEVIPAAEPVDLSYDRRCVRANAARNRPVGFNQSGVPDPISMYDGPDYSGDTAVTDQWIRVGVDGLIYGRIENALSSLSDTHVNPAANTLLCLDNVPERRGSLVEAGGVNGSTALRYNPVGITTRAVQTPVVGTPVTEPIFYFKFNFAPREYMAFRTEL